MSKLAVQQSFLNTKTSAKPVLKWAGGKTQLLPVISEKLPSQFGTKIKHYIEPFFGGGAVFFDLCNSALIDEAIIMDANPELAILYKTIKEKPSQLIEILENTQRKYLSLNKQERELNFYETRASFNQDRKASYDEANPVRAAQMIFMNRTCFNGLFRVNSKCEFNVPHGNYQNPRILDAENIYAVSEALQIAEILHADFQEVVRLAKSDTFIYYDPPYRPLSKTSNFNAYAGLFDDEHQVKLAGVFKTLHQKNVLQMLSNSDPMSASGDDFFDRIYQEFYLHRVEAKRMINSDASKRGKIFELLITNYDAN